MRRRPPTSQVDVDEPQGGPRLYFNGLIDDVRVYNRVLAVDDIAELAISAMAIWRESGLSTPEYAPWYGSGFGTTATSASVGEWRIMQAAEAPPGPRSSPAA